MVMLVKLEQNTNANLPMLVTLFGMEIFFKLGQDEKAWASMVVTLEGTVRLVSSVQF